MVFYTRENPGTVAVSARRRINRRCAMTASHAAAWASDAPTPAQLKELFAQIDYGRITGARMQVLLRGDGISFQTVKKPIMGFQILKTIELGTHETTAALHQDLLESGCRIGVGADYLLSRIALHPIRAKAELVVASAADLGFPYSVDDFGYFIDFATNQKIEDRAVELGFKPCPLEVGPQLRMQYKDQPKGERLVVAVELKTFHLGGSTAMFIVSCGDDGVLELGTYNVIPGSACEEQSRFVFLRGE